jgi:hypothetical protein
MAIACKMAHTPERELGRGRFGITYLVKNRNGDRLVIKTLSSLSPGRQMYQIYSETV